MTYQLGPCQIIYDAPNQLVISRYPDESECCVWPNENDVRLSIEMGVTPLQYKLMHELAHHHVAFAYGHETCPIVWAQAHRLPMPGNVQWLEWQILAISALALGAEIAPGDIRALFELGNVTSILKLTRELYKLWVKVKT